MAGASASLAIAAEQAALERLRKVYEARGYEFVSHPLPTDLPEAVQEQLGGYRPDAIARGPSGNVIIEVKARRESKSTHRLDALAQVVSGIPGWRFTVVYMGDPEIGERLTGAAPTDLGRVDQALAEARALLEGGHPRYALIAIWAVWEALARSLGEDTTQALSPLQTVERLAAMGHLDADEARRLRDLVALRNAVVHGVLEQEVPTEVVRRALDQVKATIGRVLQ